MISEVLARPRTEVASRPGNVVLEKLEAAIGATPSELARMTGISDEVVSAVLDALTSVGVTELDEYTGDYSFRLA